MNKQGHILTHMRKSPSMNTERWTHRYSRPIEKEIDTDTGETELGIEEVAVPGARVHDLDSGVIYHLTIDQERRGGSAITFLSMQMASPDQAIPTGKIPHSELIRHARTVLTQERPSLFDRRVIVPGVKPPFDELAQKYAELNRVALAELYDVSPSTVDRWIREARETINPETGKPYIGKARTGRPPKAPQTPAAATTKKEQDK